MKNSAFLFVPLFSEMQALKAEDHLASPPGQGRSVLLAVAKFLYQSFKLN
jgi:hypothetical protein